MKLRLLDHFPADADNYILDLPIVFTGTLGECNSYAELHGYEFKADQSIFGGYFAHPATKHCLFIT